MRGLSGKCEMDKINERPIRESGRWGGGGLREA